MSSRRWCPGRTAGGLSELNEAELAGQLLAGSKVEEAVRPVVSVEDDPAAPRRSRATMPVATAHAGQFAGGRLYADFFFQAPRTAPIRHSPTRA